jgi:hypothetical protein
MNGPFSVRASAHRSLTGLDRLQSQRFELKFQIRPEVALAVRHFVRCYLDLDDFGLGRPDLSYPVHSLYLDSDDLRLYRATVNGDSNRFKLRVRYYEDSPEAPVYLEIKRRRNECIHKQRARVRRECVPQLLAGGWPAPRHLCPPETPRQLAALQAFCRLVKALSARPRAHVCYAREAWISRGSNAVRVTMDREIRCEPQFEARLCTGFHRPVSIFGDRVVLELKFTDRFPSWFGDMTRAFGLVRGKAAKYVDGVTALGEDRYCERAPAMRFGPALAAGASGAPLQHKPGFPVGAKHVEEDDL